MLSPEGPEVSPKTPGANDSAASVTVVAEEQAREQLERILESLVFRNSKRYAAVLRYIVDRTLSGSAGQLKERAIGVDVFDRQADYDTASDHVVRSAMAEVRKRLAQYYQDTTHDGELRIEVQSGSYVPVFRHLASGRRDSNGFPERENRRARLALPAVAHRGRWIAAVVFCLVACGAALALINVRSARDPVVGLWGPVLASPAQVLLCVGNLEGGDHATPQDPPADLRTLTIRDFHRLTSHTVHISDAAALAKFVSFLQARNKPWRIATQSRAGLSEMGTGPAIMIGLMNNDWTERLVGRLRFRVERQAPRTIVIRDAWNPSRNDWSIDYSSPLLSLTKDYALALRVVDPKTDQVVVAAAGISVFGTLAAAEFLTNERELRALDRFATGDWRHKNIEVVLSTEVVRGESGRPTIVATHIW